MRASACEARPTEGRAGLTADLSAVVKDAMAVKD